MAFGVNQEIVIKLRADVAQANKALRQTEKKLLGLRGAAQSAFTRGGYADAVKRSTKATHKLNTALGKSNKEFAGWALSIMFFGMALSRIFNGIAKASTKVFQDVSHSIEGATTGFDMMQGSLKYLAFVVGEALEPVTEYLIPIIDKVSEWTEAHPKLVRQIVVTGIALGLFFTIVGTGKLAIDGLVTAFALFSSSLKIGSILLAIYKGLVWGIVYAFTFLKVFLGTVSLTQAAMFGGLIALIALAIIWIFKMQKAMGGWKNFGKSVIAGLIKGMILLGDVIKDMVINRMIEVLKVFRAVNSALGLDNKAANIDEAISQLVKFQRVGDDYLRGKLVQVDEAFGINDIRAQNEGLQGDALEVLKTLTTGSTTNIETVNIENPQSMQEVLDELAALSTTSGGQLDVTS